MAFRLELPVHNLGPYLTRHGVMNVDIFAKTSIPTDELSKLRHGLIKGIDAQKLFLIINSAELKIEQALAQVYPSVHLKETDLETQKKNINDIEGFFNSVAVNTLITISKTTSISVARLNNIKKDKVRPLAHELYLIELATKTKPGTLFNILYKDLKLNTPEEESRLRLLEKNKSARKS